MIHRWVASADLNNRSGNCPCIGACFLEPCYPRARLICDRQTEAINRAEAPFKENDMLRKFTLGLFAAAALTAMALAPTAASARGGGWSGSGGGGFHSHQSSPRLGTRFIGPAVQRNGLGTRFIGPAVQRNSHRHHWHGFGINYIGASYLGPSYVGYRYLDDGCYVVRRVPTPFGYRLRTVNVCVY
jgi:hypothetical protein